MTGGGAQILACTRRLNLCTLPRFVRAMRLAHPPCSTLALVLFALAAFGCGPKATAPDTAANPQVAPPEAKPSAAAGPTVAAGATEQQRQIGAERYNRMCAVCHGPNGEGYKADEAPAIGHAAFLSSVSDDFLRRAIVHGRTSTTMSAWGGVRGGPLTAPEVEALIVHIRGWQKEPPATLDERPISGDLERGTVLYVRECQRCHGPRGTGGKHIRIGEPGLLNTASNGFLRLAIAKGRAGTPMPAFGETLGEQGVEDLVAYVRSLEQAPTAYEPALAVRPPPLPLGPVPLNPKGREPKGFAPHPGMTSANVVHEQLTRGAKLGILDARAPSDYTSEHIAGAVSVPFYDPSPYLTKLPKDTWLVCYCACPHAESGILAQKLKENGFTKVTVLSEGLGFWKSKGYGTRQGAAP